MQVLGMKERWVPCLGIPTAFAKIVVKCVYKKF